MPDPRSFAYATAHVPGAVSIPLRAQFATWLGWLIPADVPLVVVRDADQDFEEIVWPAVKIGYDSLAGEAPIWRCQRAAHRPRVDRRTARRDGYRAAPRDARAHPARRSQAGRRRVAGCSTP